MANLSNIRASVSFVSEQCPNSNGGHVSAPLDDMCIHCQKVGVRKVAYSRAYIRVWHTFAIQVVAESDIPLQPDGSVLPSDERKARVAALEMLADKLAGMADDSLEAWGSVKISPSKRQQIPIIKETCPVAESSAVHPNHRCPACPIDTQERRKQNRRADDDPDDDLECDTCGGYNASEMRTCFSCRNASRESAHKKP